MSAGRDADDAESAFVTFGSYPPPKAERLLDALGKAHVRFEIECDDGARYNSGKFGFFGTESKINVFVHSDDLKKANTVWKDLFDDIIP